MSDWEKWFAEMRHVNPRISGLGGNINTNWWEEMYQMFKARFIEESLPSPTVNESRNNAP